MTQRNWPQLKQKWIKAGCPALAQFAETEGIPLSTVYKVTRDQRWSETRQELGTEMEHQLVEKEAIRNAAFRDRLMIIGRALQDEGLRKLKVTQENALEAVRLGTRLEEIGVYGPAGMRGGDTAPLVLQTNTVIYQQVLQIVQGQGSKQRKILGKALERAIGRRAAKARS